MGELSIYIIKSSLCLIVFLLFYKITLSNETFHRFNRFALLGIILLSIIIPAIRFSNGDETELYNISAIIEEASITAETVGLPGIGNTDEINIRRILILSGYFVYITGLIFFLVRNIFSFIKIVKITNSGKREDINSYISTDKNKSYKLTITDRNISPFSWMSHIVISQTDMQENGTEILTHEMAHVRNRHSLDLILADICILLQWFNPAAWILKTELQNIHEFEADEIVINNGIDAKNYQLLLIKKAVGSRLYSIANSFNHSKLKKRITMMMKKKSNPWARAKYLYVLPLAAVAVAAFARPEVSEFSNEISSVKVNDFSAITENHEVENSLSVSDKKVIIEGSVVDDSTGTPIAGACVIIKNTTNGTITDIDGKFTLEANENSVIVFSFIGKQTHSVIASKEGIESMKKTPIRLKEEISNMDEIVVVGYESNTEQPKQSQQNTTSKSDEEVFMVVEQMPEFPGGMAEFMKYVARNIKYPVLAQKENIQGRVIVQFTVGKDGSTYDFIITRSVSPYLDAEAIRVLSNMPKWKPGMQRGQAVAVKFTVPVTFRLKKNQSINTGKYETSSIPTININKPIDNVLIVIDNKAVSQDEFTSLNPDKIESVHVIKDTTETGKICKIHGVLEKKEGVILIKTKKDKS